MKLLGRSNTSCLDLNGKRPLTLRSSKNLRMESSRELGKKFPITFLYILREKHFKL